MIKISPTYIQTIVGLSRVQNAHGGTTNASAATFTITFASNISTSNFVAFATGIKSSGPPDFKITATGANFIYARSNTSLDPTGSLTTELAWGRVDGPASVFTIGSITGGAQNMAGIGVEYGGSQIAPDTTALASTGIGASTITASLANQSPASLYIGSLCFRTTSPTVNTNWAGSPTNSFTIVDQVTTNTNVTNGDFGIAFADLITTTSALRSCSQTTSLTPNPNRYCTSLQTFKEINSFTPGQ